MRRACSGNRQGESGAESPPELGLCAFCGPPQAAGWLQGSVRPPLEVVSAWLVLPQAQGE